ncbi:MAG: RagB/SusD family nutrient uptake outer membrane protein, partial [Eudoraea sp.]|nr:RagB/SusD family nutrient uptake outer membrane protein [Eudoraea sp.]
LELYTAEDLYMSENDVRFTELIQELLYEDFTIYHSAKYGYEPEEDDPSEYMNIPVLRSAELVLMRAEINAVNGQLSAALSDLNMILERAGHTALSPPIQQARLIELIAIERMKELDMEGDRFYNWKRMGAYNTEVFALYPAVVYSRLERDGTSYDWDSQESLARIPQDEMNGNPALGPEDQN